MESLFSHSLTINGNVVDPPNVRENYNDNGNFNWETRGVYIDSDDTIECSTNTTVYMVTVVDSSTPYPAETRWVTKNDMNAGTYYIDMISGTWEWFYLSDNAYVIGGLDPDYGDAAVASRDVSSNHPVYLSGNDSLKLEVSETFAPHTITAGFVRVG